MEEVQAKRGEIFFSKKMKLHIENPIRFLANYLILVRNIIEHPKTAKVEIFLSFIESTVAGCLYFLYS